MDRGPRTWSSVDKGEAPPGFAELNVEILTATLNDTLSVCCEQNTHTCNSDALVVSGSGRQLVQ